MCVITKRTNPAASTRLGSRLTNDHAPPQNTPTCWVVLEVRPRPPLPAPVTDVRGYCHLRAPASQPRRRERRPHVRRGSRVTLAVPSARAPGLRVTLAVPLRPAQGSRLEALYAALSLNRQLQGQMLVALSRLERVSDQRELHSSRVEGVRRPRAPPPQCARLLSQPSPQVRAFVRCGGVLVHKSCPVFQS